MEAKEKIIVALDVSDFEKMLELVDKLEPHVGCFKVGLEFMQFVWSQLLSCDEHRAKHGLEMLRFIFAEMQGKIFWDGKFNDIPNTVAGAVRNTRAMGVKFFTVHASAGIEAMKRAAENKGGAKLLAVTVLTSLNEGDSRWIFGRTSEEKVSQFARAAKLAGCDGVVCSPQELGLLNEDEEHKNLLKITPGVRPAWAAAGDQKRVMTPGEAIRAGADYLVIGRPITEPPAEIGGPAEAVKRIIQEIEEAEVFSLNGKISVAELEKILPKICGRETSSNPAGWQPENPLHGHCAVVSLLAQDLFGGELLRIPLDGTAFAEMRSHYYNRLPSGDAYDFTRAQFGDRIPYHLMVMNETRERAYLLSNAETAKRYELLRKKFLILLGAEKEVAP